MMKCPVCEKQIENTVSKCPNCGFEDLRTEFINENELEMWRTYVVYPCKFAYQTSITQQAFADLRSNLYYHQTMRFIIETDAGEETIDANIDYWTDGALTAIAEVVTQIESVNLNNHILHTEPTELVAYQATF